MGYNSIKDLIEEEKAQKGSYRDTGGIVENIELTSAQSRFPCIHLGDSSAVVLYDEVAHQDLVNPLISGGYNLHYSVRGNWIDVNKIGEALQSIGGPISNIGSPAAGDSTPHPLLYYSQEESLESEPKSDAQMNAKKSSTAGCIDFSDSSLSNEPTLDKTVRCLPNTTSRQCRQLEDGGLHTVRWCHCRTEL